MRYLLCIYSDEAADAAMTPAEQQAVMGAYYAFTKDVKDSGAYGCASRK
jgi:hypothetical protein